MKRRNGKSLARLVKIGWIFLVIASAQEKPATLPEDIASDTYELYSSVLKDAKAIAIDVAGDWYNEAWAKCIAPNSAEDKAMLDRARELGKNHYIWEARFNLNHQYKLLSVDEVKNIFCRPQADGCMHVLGGAELVYFLSAPGFNADRTRALVYIASSCGGLCGDLQIVEFRKTKTGWTKVAGGFARCRAVA